MNDGFIILAALCAVIGSAASFVMGFHAGARTIHELCMRKANIMRVLHLTAAACLVLGGVVGASFWAAVTEPVRPCPDCSAPPVVLELADAAGGAGGAHTCEGVAGALSE